MNCIIGVIVFLYVLVGTVVHTADAFFDGSAFLDNMLGGSFSDEWNTEEEGAVVETVIENHASTGGNSANGSNGANGGTVITGSASADVHVETHVNGTGTSKTIIDVSVTDDTESITKHEETSGNADTIIHIKTDGGISEDAEHTVREDEKSEKEEAEKRMNGDTEMASSTKAEDASITKIKDTERRQSRRGIIQALTSLFSYVFSLFNR
ncbi:MAG: hypothetical protein COU90_02400 [Candidatus Ryanbacteria bacterium CG10_big_fil_rev_8_21_14_0_10_43_42]|uniref:Uncharacterized protein n=1 Tax=Candidatus Ryanbacteria bacterium CG10_big_fil_rev_8_21_14_0_10_43_42 TaxID=1974864 RepID=A0A2M8KWK1_9BACT|nr:MAG: hypothetical protein COU90_02400 [Candidatus Ryanbacteria bacterium CG10_big_fil_rev_8_21_14_0_10_43_42]